MQRLMWRSLACAGVLFAAGCGGGRSTKTYPVKGTVTYQGQPLAEVVISFVPEKGRPASGTTDAQGSFSLSTFDPNDGAPAGAYKIAIAEPAPEMAEGDYSIPPEKPPRFPVKYTNPYESELVAEVKPSSENDFKFDLK